jgi:hypothetical protein
MVAVHHSGGVDWRTSYSAFTDAHEEPTRV